VKRITQIHIKNKTNDVQDIEILNILTEGVQDIRSVTFILMNFAAQKALHLDEKDVI
jgi:hypothetical protein